MMGQLQFDIAAGSLKSQLSNGHFDMTQQTTRLDAGDDTANTPSPPNAL